MRRLPVWAVGALAVSYFVLWACAPMVGLPAPVPMAADQPNELGIAPVALASETDTAPPTLATYWGAHGWYQRRLAEHWDLGLQLSGGKAQVVSGGMMVRGRFLTTDRFTFGAQAGLGFLYAEAGLFAAGGLGDRVWLYAVPQAGARGIATFRLPVGARFALTPQTGLSVEVGAGWPTYSTSLGPTITQEPLFWAALGVDYRFR